MTPAGSEAETVVDVEKFKFELGYRTDSYVFAIQHCSVPLQSEEHGGRPRVFFTAEVTHSLAVGGLLTGNVF